LYFVHPASGKKMEFIAPVQESMRDYLEENFDMEFINEAIDTTDFSRHFNSI
jgi:23S rRNA pseudouridine1911/1915/1917 synthase